MLFQFIKFNTNYKLTFTAQVKYDFFSRCAENEIENSAGNSAVWLHSCFKFKFQVVSFLYMGLE